MSTRSAAFCPVCNETMALDEDLEQHLVREHEPRELAKQLVAEWEAEELGEAV